MTGNTSLEWFLLASLLVAVGYILYLEKRPKSDAERDRRANEKARLQDLIRRKSARQDQLRQEKADR